MLLGQGTGGGALAVMPADRVIRAQHSWLSPLPPEGASAILHRETDHASELASSQRVRSLDLLADGIVDRIVAEHPDAADEPEDFCRRMSQTIQHEPPCSPGSHRPTASPPASTATAGWRPRTPERRDTAAYICQ